MMRISWTILSHQDIFSSARKWTLVSQFKTNHHPKKIRKFIPNQVMNKLSLPSIIPRLQMLNRECYLFKQSKLMKRERHLKHQNHYSQNWRHLQTTNFMGKHPSLHTIYNVHKSIVQRVLQSIRTTHSPVVRQHQTKWHRIPRNHMRPKSKKVSLMWHLRTTRPVIPIATTSCPRKLKYRYLSRQKVERMTTTHSLINLHTLKSEMI